MFTGEHMTALRIRSNLWKIATETPYNKGIYAYLYLDPRIDEKLQIIDGFNTFHEIADELVLFDRSFWNLKWDLDHTTKFNVYSINGNGFLKKEKNGNG